MRKLNLLRADVLIWLQMLRITLQGVFVAANKYTALNRWNRYLGGKIKADETERVMWEVKNLVKGREPISTLRDFRFLWVMPNKKIDPDNISSAQKFIFDGLVRVGLLKDDNWAVVHSILHNYTVDPTNPRVQIYIKEVHETWETGK